MKSKYSTSQNSRVWYAPLPESSSFFRASCLEQRSRGIFRFRIFTSSLCIYRMEWSVLIIRAQDHAVVKCYSVFWILLIKSIRSAVYLPVKVCSGIVIENPIKYWRFLRYLRAMRSRRSARFPGRCNCLPSLVIVYFQIIIDKFYPPKIMCRIMISRVFLITLKNLWIRFICAVRARCTSNILFYLYFQYIVSFYLSCVLEFLVLETHRSKMHRTCLSS